MNIIIQWMLAVSVLSLSAGFLAMVADRECWHFNRKRKWYRAGKMCSECQIRFRNRMSDMNS